MRSIEEWTASVIIAIEPVIAAAAILIAIRTELERIESPAAPDLDRITSRGRGRPAADPPSPAPPPGEHLGQGARRAAAVADRVLLRRAQLGHRAPVVRPG